MSDEERSEKAEHFIDFPLPLQEIITRADGARFREITADEEARLLAGDRSMSLWQWQGKIWKRIRETEE